MKKKSGRILAAALVAVVLWNVSEWHPQALAGNFPSYVEETEELSDEVLYQEVPYGTKYKDLELPTKLNAYLVFEDDEDEAETATRSQASVRKATSSQAVVKKASASEVESSQEVSGNGYWKELRVRWVLDEVFSEAEEYDPEQPGVYVFNAELKNSRYDADETSLPRIEVTVLPEEEQVATFADEAAETAVISVDIAWGHMDFTYWDGPWDTQLLDYRSGKWKDTVTGGNWVIVTNDSNIPVRADYEFSNASSGISDEEIRRWMSGLQGKFTTEAEGAGTEMEDQILKARGQDGSSAKAYLSLDSAKPPKSFQTGSYGEVIGTVTVSISQPDSTANE